MLKILMTAAITWYAAAAYEHAVSGVIANFRDDDAVTCAVRMRDNAIEPGGWRECMANRAAELPDAEIRALAWRGLLYAVAHPLHVFSEIKS